MKFWRRVNREVVYVKHEIVFAVLLALFVAVACLVGCGNDICGCPFGMVCAVGRDGKMTCAPAPRQVASSDEETTQ